MLLSLYVILMNHNLPNVFIPNAILLCVVAPLTQLSPSLKNDSLSLSFFFLFCSCSIRFKEFKKRSRRLPPICPRFHLIRTSATLPSPVRLKKWGHLRLPGIRTMQIQNIIGDVIAAQFCILKRISKISYEKFKRKLTKEVRKNILKLRYGAFS